MALTKIGKEGITGISNASDATAITIDASENVGIGTSNPSGIGGGADLAVNKSGGARFVLNNNSRQWAIRGDSGSDDLRITARGSNDTVDADYVTIASGNVGIGTTAPLSLLHLASNAPYITFEDKDNNQDWQIQATAWFAIRDQTANAERMRIDSSGRLLVNTTAVLSFASSAPIQVLSSGIAGAFKNTTAGSQTISVYNTGDSGTRYLMWFESNASRTHVGSITSNGSATAYNTSSDYRLKENVDYTWDATTRLKQLKPARFNFIADADRTVDGFLAHEVSSIVPEAITGTKDAMTTEVLYVEGDELPEGVSIGDVKEASVPDYQGIDQSKLVPLLVKTIQELEARITALEA